MFLESGLHRALGQDLAILKVRLFYLMQTPNFAMDTTDVDPNADRAQVRFTSHLFDQSLESIAGPSGSAARLPSDMSIWPPPALFDAVYASAVVHHFGVALTEILEKWGDVFYPTSGGPTEAAHADYKCRRDQADVDKENRSLQKAARRYERRGRRIDPHDVVMMYRFKAMEPEKVRAYLKGCEEVAAAIERKELEEKVNSWRESSATLLPDPDNSGNR